MLSKVTEFKALLKQELLVIISAPSGTGKTSLCKELCRREPSLKKIVTLTSRPARPQEAQEKEYIFVSPKEFKKNIEKGVFLEWAEVHGYLYGTLAASVEEALKEKKVALLTIDVQGAMKIKELFPEAVLIFLLPPSEEELVRRLKARKTETEDQFRERLKNSKREVDHCSFYDYIVINKDFNEALERIKAIIKAESCRTRRFLSNFESGEAKGNQS